METFRNKGLSFLLAALLLFVSVVHFAMPVRAEGEHPDVEATGMTYTWDDEGGFYVGVVMPDCSEGTITVPDGCHLVMDDSTGENHLPVTTVTIESGGFLELFGSATFAGTLAPVDGASISFEGPGNVPESITLYAADGEAEFDYTEEIGGTVFTYSDSKWIHEAPEGDDTDDTEDPEGEPEDPEGEDPEEDEEEDTLFQTLNDPGEGEEPPWFNINLGGFDPQTDSLTIQYKFTGESEGDYRTAEHFYEQDADPRFPDNYFGGFVVDDIPDQWDNKVDLKITLTSNRPYIGVQMVFADGGGDGEPEDLSGNISQDGTVFTLNRNYDDIHWIGISLAYPNSGNPDIVNTADDYLYAYCPTQTKTVAELFAEELICRLMDPSLYEYFGMEEGDRSGNISELYSHRIVTVGSPYSVNATNASGGTTPITVQDYKVTWGKSNVDGSPVISTLPVYTLNSDDKVLICTDFNESTGRGSTFYLCDLSSDSVNFSNGTLAPSEGIRFVVSNVNLSTSKTGGMGHISTLINGDGICTFEVIAGGEGSYLRETYQDEIYASKIRLLKASEKYVTVKGEGESNNYGLIGDNGSTCDSIWATGNNTNAEARVYVGDSVIHLYPLNSTTGMSGTSITSVTLADASQADGVTLDATNPSDITLSFESNFYDKVPLRITFEGGAVKYITITRVGLVIQYQYLGGDPDRGEDDNGDPIVDHGEIIQDYCNQSIDYDYSYYSGEQVAIWATYYLPTNDPTGGASDYMLYLTFNNGSHEIVYADDNDHNFNGRLNPGGANVKSVSFLIDFEQARDYFDGDVWIGQRDEFNYRRGGFYATVLNAGYNDNTTYSGTQIGSGKGVYWDGHISFYR